MLTLTATSKDCQPAKTEWFYFLSFSKHLTLIFEDKMQIKLINNKWRYFTLNIIYQTV